MDRHPHLYAYIYYIVKAIVEDGSLFCKSLFPYTCCYILLHVSYSSDLSLFEK